MKMKMKRLAAAMAFCTLIVVGVYAGYDDCESGETYLPFYINDDCNPVHAYYYDDYGHGYYKLCYETDSHKFCLKMNGDIHNDCHKRIRERNNPLIEYVVSDFVCYLSEGYYGLDFYRSCFRVSRGGDLKFSGHGVIDYCEYD